MCRTSVSAVLSLPKGGASSSNFSSQNVSRLSSVCEAAVEVFLCFEIKSLWGLAEGLIENLRRDLTVLDQLGPSLTILVGFGLVLKPDDARILIGEPGVSGVDHWGGTQRKIEHGADPGERLGPEFAVSIFNDRIDRIPEIRQQAVTEGESLAKTGVVLRRQQGLGEPRGQLQIFGDGGKRVLRQLEDQRVIRDLAFALPVALCQVVVLAPGFP